MKPLSQSEYGELRSLYQKVYAPRFETILDEFTDEEVDELTEEIIEDVVEEFFLECLEEGWDIESVEETLCESLETSITALNEAVLLEMNPYAPAGSKEAQAYNKATTASKRSAERAAKRKEVIGKVKKAVGKVGSALKSGAGKAASAAKAGAKAAYKGASKAAGSAVGTVKKAASVAKSEFKKGYESASKSSSSDSESSDSDSSASSGSGGASSSGGTRKAVGGALRSVGRLLKKGLKKAVGGTARAISRGADKVATRMGEEVENQEADSLAAMKASRERRLAGKSLAAQRRRERERNVADKVWDHEAELKKEELEATGLFSEKEIEAILEAEINEGSYEDRIAANNKKYDRNRKRAAQRAAARNAARDAGQTGAVPGVGYVTPRKEKETYTDSSGKTRHAKGL